MWTNRGFEESDYFDGGGGGGAGAGADNEDEDAQFSLPVAFFSGSGPSRLVTPVARAEAPSLPAENLSVISTYDKGNRGRAEETVRIKGTHKGGRKDFVYC